MTVSRAGGADPKGALGEADCGLASSLLSVTAGREHPRCKGWLAGSGQVGRRPRSLDRMHHRRQRL